MNQEPPQNQLNGAEASEPAVKQLTVSEATQMLGVDSFTVVSLIQRDKLLPSRSLTGEIVLTPGELAKLTQEGGQVLLKRKGQIVESVARGSTTRFTHGEREAYTPAFEAIQPELDELRQIQRQVRSFQQTIGKRRAGLSDASAIVTVEGIKWHAQALLLRLPKCAIFLCRHPTENEFAIVHLFPAESAYAIANGRDRILLRSANPHQLVCQYAAEARHTLRFMASNLVAKAQRVAWEQFLNLMMAPARLTVEEAAWLLGFSPHEIPILVAKGLLKPLGRPPANGPKYFATTTVAELRKNAKWLTRASDVIVEHWRFKNTRKNEAGPRPMVAA